MLSAYHEGELDVQRRAGVEEEAGRVGRIVGSAMPAAAMQFLEARPFVIVGSVDEQGAVWASLVVGAARAADERTVVLAPTGGNLDHVFQGDAGLLAIDFATRRRMRVNGRARRDGARIVIETREVYSNCPQYIHPQETQAAMLSGPTRSSTTLSDAQQAWIRSADTFFIASAHPTAGADASHRGGEPGFVRADAYRVAWTDYRGNNMFNTLGNLAVNPRCGLLFTDFHRTLQITGLATIHWVGTVRAVEVAVELTVDS